MKGPGTLTPSEVNRVVGPPSEKPYCVVGNEVSTRKAFLHHPASIGKGAPIVVSLSPGRDLCFPYLWPADRVPEIHFRFLLSALLPAPCSALSAPAQPEKLTL